MLMSVMGYQYYFKTLRKQSVGLQKATNKMGALKADMEKMRQQLDTNVKIGRGGVGAPSKAGGGLKGNANQRLKQAMQQRQKATRK